MSHNKYVRRGVRRLVREDHTPGVKSSKEEVAVVMLRKQADTPHAQRDSGGDGGCCSDVQWVRAPRGARTGTERLELGSGISMCAGGVTEAAAQGIERELLADHGRWKSVSGVEQYDRNDKRKFARVSSALQKGLRESGNRTKKRRVTKAL